MAKISDEELKKAFRYWILKYNSKNDEPSLLPYLSDQIVGFSLIDKDSKSTGWLRKTRKALFLSAKAVAHNLNVSRAAYSKFEESEENGSITLSTLAKAAGAMDCELVYAIRPKSKKYFSEIIWQKLLAVSTEHPWMEVCDQKKRARALAFVAEKYMHDPKFRNEQGWSQRANKKELL